MTMQRPDFHGAAAPSPAEFAAIAARLRRQDPAAVIPTDAAWVERIVAAATAAAKPQSAPRWRQLAAAAVAFLGLHGVAAAVSTAAVGAAVVVGMSVWPEGRNSRETMTLSMAVELLERDDQPEQARAAALLAVAQKIRARAERLLVARDAAQSTVEDRTEADAQLASLATLVHRPVGVLHPDVVAALALPVDFAEADVAQAMTVNATGRDARALLARMMAAPLAPETLQAARAALLLRLAEFLDP